MEHHRRRMYWQLGIGIFLIVIGGLMLLNRFDIFNTGSVWHFWPVIFIAVGFARLADAQETHEYRNAVFWLFIGSWFLINELHLLGLSYHNSWPILLIGWGVGMLTRPATPRRVHCQEIPHGN